MESDNLKTASLYINNQLLSRGLLRDGQTIEFARPERGEGGVSGTMGRIMSVVNDLILRRDRDATQRESLSTTIRALRADSLRLTSSIESLTTKNSESTRKVAIAESSERALKLQLKSAEQSALVLKQEMAKMKVLVAQTRAQCANEVRKREKVIEGLKRHVEEKGRVRGGGKAVGVVSVTVVPGVGGRESKDDSSSALDVRDEGYDLRSETNEFLTELARGLSEENEHVSGLLRRTVDTLRTLSGWEREETMQQDGGGGSRLVVNLDGANDNVTGDMEEVIEHLRTLLTNPSFVPIEELEVREEEIQKLREGFERMESRWKEAVQMMDGWRKRMARSGQTVNLEELKMGLLLSPLKERENEVQQERLGLSMVMEEGEGDTQVDIDAMIEEEAEMPDPADFEEEDSFDEEESSLFEDDPVDTVRPDENMAIEEEREEGETLNTVSSASPGPAPQLSPLKETAGNSIPLLRPNGPQKENFTTIVEENTLDLLELDTSSPQKKPMSPTRKADLATESVRQPIFNTTSTTDDDIDLLQTSSSTSISTSLTTSQPTSEPKAPPPTSRLTLTSPRKPSSSSSRTPNIKSQFHDPPVTRVSRPTSTPKLRHNDASSRLPRPQNERAGPGGLGLPQQSPLTMATIAAKLAATEREADAARVRAKLKAARAARLAKPVAQQQPRSVSNASGSKDHEEKATAIVQVNGDGGGTEEGIEKDVERENNIPVVEGMADAGGSRKRKANGRVQGGRANRRRSTLSPWEMESLIQGGIAAAVGGSPAKE